MRTLKVPVSKRRGAWEVDKDTSLPRGNRPEPEDFRNAGIEN